MGQIATMEALVTRQQPDGSVEQELITVRQEYDDAGQPVGEATETREKVTHG